MTHYRHCKYIDIDISLSFPTDPTSKRAWLHCSNIAKQNLLVIGNNAC